MNTNLSSLTSLSALSSTAVSRRSLFKLSLGGALGVGLAASGLSLLGGPTLTVGAALPAFQAYHGVNGATHQAKFNDLSTTGYRMISLSIYGDPTDPRYAAVWVQKPGGAFIAMHGITADEYQSRFTSATAQGFAPILVSATGPANNARFAAVFEQGGAGGWKARHGIDADTYASENIAAISDNLILRSVAMYGDHSARRYAGIWVPNTKSITWPLVTDVSAAWYQQSFDALNSHGYHPRYVAVGGDQNVTAVFGDDNIGAWIARHNLTADQYQQAFTDATAQGYIPISVQGGGTGTNTRYAAIFATQLP